MNGLREDCGSRVKTLEKRLHDSGVVIAELRNQLSDVTAARDSWIEKVKEMESQASFDKVRSFRACIR
jgi:uncharacterized coiled-coil DUF342 family protein